MSFAEPIRDLREDVAGTGRRLNDPTVRHDLIQRLERVQEQERALPAIPLQF